MHNINKLLIITTIIGLYSSGVFAEDEPSPTASFGVDIASRYYYRGIIQNRKGVNLQPYLGVGLPLVSTDGYSLNYTLGTWNSFQPGNEAPKDATAPRAWYESDLYTGLSFSYLGFSVSPTYTAYTSPNGSYATIHELSLGLSYDDSWVYKDMLNGKFSGIQPHIAAAFELDGTAFGEKEGIYLELGIQPTGTPFDADYLAIDLSLPITAGFSLNDYYEFIDSVTDKKTDDALGYLSFGLSAALRLKFMPKRLGNWKVTGAAQLLLLTGDNLKAKNDSQSVAFVGKGGLAIDF
jgi:hypothetical protein